MTSRTDMDRPATVLSASLGVVLIAVSILLFVFLGGATSTRYEVAWSQQTVDEKSSPFGISSTPTQITIPVTDDLPSNATVTVTCTDGATPPVQPAATVSWRLFVSGNSNPIASGNSCSTAATVVRLGGHPDVASIKAGSASEAEGLAMGDDVKTADYRLEVTATRAASPGGLPVPAPTFTGQAKLKIQDWNATANAPGQEATR